MKELENNWMKKWESVKEKTVCPVDLNTYFEQEEIAGKSLTTINIGSCDLPSGNLLVRDHWYISQTETNVHIFRTLLRVNMKRKFV